LVKTNAISKQNYENAQTSADQAEAEVAAQEAALRTAQIDLARTTRCVYWIGSPASAA
jgi:membrane fusion protein (multidrug efflux system)